MAKVKMETVEAAVLKLADKIIATMPNSTYKFLLGGAASLLGTNGFAKMRETAKSFQDERGLVDTQLLRKLYGAAFKASGGKLSVELFSNPGSLVSLLVKPVTLTITQADVDELMAEVELNAVVEEVSLSQPQPQPQTSQPA